LRAFAATEGQIAIRHRDAFLLSMGAAWIAGGFGFHFPKRYIYAAMAFSGAVEGLNELARRRRKQPPT